MSSAIKYIELAEHKNLRSLSRTIAMIHKEAIPLGFLSRLGTGFLSSLYRAITFTKGCTVIVALDKEDRVCGFVSGTVNISSMYRRILLNYWHRFFFHILWKLINPLVIKRIFETLFYPKKEMSKDHGNRVSPAELLSIAVTEEARGKGVGKGLVDKLDRFYRDTSNISEYYVVTYSGDERSNSFYKRRGFDFVRAFDHHDNVMHEYKKLLCPKKSGVQA